jgi:DNA processing protein
VTVLSGGARGIDQAAHLGALDAGGVTVMVLGCGLAVDYPKGSWELRQRVAESGAVISELPPDAPPRPSQFPRRNRIAAALVDAVLVVQAGERSGALVTARLAQELGRKILAVPGMPGTPLTRGTHGLLRQGALLAESSRDVMTAIGLEAADAPPGEPPPRLRGVAAKVVRLLDGGPTSAEEVARAIDRPVGEALALLVELELEGLVSCQAGCYERV